MCVYVFVINVNFLSSYCTCLPSDSWVYSWVTLNIIYCKFVISFWNWGYVSRGEILREVLWMTMNEIYPLYLTLSLRLKDYHFLFFYVFFCFYEKSLPPFKINPYELNLLLKRGIQGLFKSIRRIKWKSCFL